MCRSDHSGAPGPSMNLFSHSFFPLSRCPYPFRYMHRERVVQKNQPSIQSLVAANDSYLSDRSCQFYLNSFPNGSLFKLYFRDETRAVCVRTVNDQCHPKIYRNYQKCLSVLVWCPWFCESTWATWSLKKQSNASEVPKSENYARRARWTLRAPLVDSKSKR